MITSLGVMNSDSVDRYGNIFPLTSFFHALEQSWRVGIPNLLGHDFHRLVGWTFPSGIHLQGGTARLTSVSYHPETRDEQSQLAVRGNRFLQTRIQRRVGPYVSELSGRIGDEIGENLCWIDPECAALVGPGLALNIFKDIFGSRDKDGLVPLSRLTEVAPGVFENKGLLLFAHPYFRRSLSRFNTLNGPFLRRFSRVSPVLNPRIALDEDMVGLASSLGPSRVELQYWWGPKFDDDLSKIRNGISVHAATDADRVFTGIVRTEFWWYCQKGERSFEAEELVNGPSAGISTDEFGCRFVHSMLNDKSQKPVHLDGAVRLYDEERMVRRLDCNIFEAGRHANYQKLWRIDGTIAVDLWKELVAHYFRDNFLVGEYLGAEPLKLNERPSVFASTSNPLHPFVPYDLRPDDGVQVHVSFHDRTASKLGRSIRMLDTVTNRDIVRPFVELNATELFKLFKRSGETLLIPNEVNRVKFGDMVINLPLIAHAGPDALALATRSLEIIGAMCDKLAELRPECLLSFAIAVEYPDREVWYSFAGHLVALCKWIRSWPTQLSSDVEGIGQWTEAIYSKLNILFPGDHPIDHLHQLLQPSGLLLFRRRFLEPTEFEVDQEKEAFRIRVKFAKDFPRAQLIHNRQLQASAAFLVHRSRCSHCSKSYFECPCSKLFDPDVSQIVQKYEFVGAFWTSRSTWIAEASEVLPRNPRRQK